MDRASPRTRGLTLRPGRARVISANRYTFSASELFPTADTPSMASSSGASRATPAHPTRHFGTYRANLYYKRNAQSRQHAEQDARRETITRFGEEQPVPAFDAWSTTSAPESRRRRRARRRPARRSGRKGRQAKRIQHRHNSVDLDHRPHRSFGCTRPALTTVIPSVTAIGVALESPADIRQDFGGKWNSNQQFGDSAVHHVICIGRNGNKACQDRDLIRGKVSWSNNPG